MNSQDPNAPVAFRWVFPSGTPNSEWFSGVPNETEADKALARMGCVPQFAYAHPAPPQTPMTDAERDALYADMNSLVYREREDIMETIDRVERHHGIGPARGG